MKAGRTLVFILIAVGLWGIAVNGAEIYSRLLYLGILLGLGSWLWTFLLGRSLGVQRIARTQRASVGDIFEERFYIVNGSRLIAPWIEVTNDTSIFFRFPFAYTCKWTAKTELPCAYLAHAPRRVCPGPYACFSWRPAWLVPLEQGNPAKTDSGDSSHDI